MKSPAFAAFFLTAVFATTALGQAKSAATNNQPGSNAGDAGTSSQGSAPSATRVRVLKQNPNGGAATVAGERLQAHVRSDFNNHPEAAAPRNTAPGTATTSNNPPMSTLLTSPSPSSASRISPNASRTSSDSASRLHTGFKPATAAKGNGTSVVKTSGTTAPGSNRPAGVTNPPARVTPAPTAAAITASASQVYRVGVRDVLDIQLSANPGRESTLFTVLEGGMLEYPFAGGPIPVAGLTTTEIAALLRQHIKIFDNPAVTVNVRDYSSHTVTVSGFVAAPGTKTLRREAVPLYALLAEALVLPEAARATITRQGRAPIPVDLKDANLSATLVVAGDSIKVSGLPPGPTEFFFIGGEINSPGQKAFSAGLTLTQAILASGGTSAGAGSKVRVSRQGADGLLATEEYNLRKILGGKLPDPVLQKGDRIEVTNDN